MASAGLVHSVFHGEYVALSFGLATVGAYVGIHLCEQFRLSSRENQSKLLSRQMLMVLMACSIGGVAIWSMHFVGMAAVSFTDPDGVPLPVYYRYDYTLVSLAVVIILCYAGIYICSRDAAFMIDKIDTIDAFIENTQKLSIAEIRKLKTSAVMVMFLALTKSPLSLLLGGVVTASGVCVMHYLGMSAVVIDAELVWAPGIVVASVFIAIVAATAAYWILFRLLALYPQVELLRLASSLVAAVAVNGMHYTGMAAATYVYKPGEAVKTTAGMMESNIAVVGAIIASMMFLWIVVLLVLADVRSWFYRSANTVRMADKVSSGGSSELLYRRIVKRYVFYLYFTRCRCFSLSHLRCPLIYSRFHWLHPPTHPHTRLSVHTSTRTSTCPHHPTLPLHSTIPPHPQLIRLIELETTLGVKAQKVLNAYIRERGDNICSEKLSQTEASNKPQSIQQAMMYVGDETVRVVGGV